MEAFFVKTDEQMNRGTRNRGMMKLNDELLIMDY